MSASRYWLVLPAAGRGKRLGSSTPKQYLTIAGHSLLEWALWPFLQDTHCEGAVLALGAEDNDWQAIRARLARPVQEVQGGAERSDSVLAALQHLKEMGVADQEWVLVHDAARPAISSAEIFALCQAVWQADAIHASAGHASPVGGLLALPLADTLKRGVARDGAVHAAETPSREGLWRALTPQMFRLGDLSRALEAARAAGRIPTDEAQAMEWQGAQALLVAGEATNVKVTTTADLAWVAGVLAQRQPPTR